MSGRLFLMSTMVSMMLSGLARASTVCDDQCEADAILVYQLCLADLGPDATQADFDACRDESRTFRDTCRAGCPDDPNDGDNCRDDCEIASGAIFDDCVALLGDNPTNDEIDVCEDEARAFRAVCAVDCPVDCHDQCSADANVFFNDCVAMLGAGATDAEIDACKDDARIVRDNCRALCPMSCSNQCQLEADTFFADCVAALGENPTQADIDQCDADADDVRRACKDLCPEDNLDPSECRDLCEADASVIFEDCVALLGPNPTNDEIDVCEAESRVARNACNATCPIDCDEQCGQDTRQLYEDCIAAFGDTLTDADEEACKNDARAQRDLCRANCDIAPAMMKQHRGTGKSRNR